ncbi:MAG: ABC transporter ATP-binding protein [Spirochaetes bacterium]|nr:ABC transporter ATP-binding protein [Spirochaetota bacterium]MBN2769183.1 ABC transporter ATP-binding protein [Spirochaetota bacterium]
MSIKQKKESREVELFKEHYKGKLYRRLLKISLTKWRLLAGFLTAIIITAFIDSTNTYISKFIIDDGVIPGNTQTMFKYGLIMFALFLLNSMAIFTFIFCAGRLGEHMQYHLRKEQFSHLQKLSFSFFDRVSSGWLLSRITSDSRRIAELCTWMFLDMTWGAVNIVVALIFMATINLKLMLVVALMTPILVIASIKFRSLILKEYRKVRSINSQITSAYSENISGVRIVKALNREEKNLANFSKITRQMHKRSFRAGWLSAFFLPVVQMITTLAVAAILYVGGSDISTGALSVGELRAFIGYVLFMMWPIENLSRVFSEMQRSIASAERVFSLLDTPSGIADRKGSHTKANFKGKIDFCSVSFHYEKDSPVLKNINLSVMPGEVIAIVGPTGGGKSTLVNLAARFYEPCKGKILFDGEDYRNWTQEALQHRIGIVLQDPHLFSGTIRENILYGKPDATEEEIITAASRVQAHEMICRLPNGYQENVGEAGNLLSIGQKQLISLARTIISDPDIIIMDEATSSIDSLTEHLIQEGIHHLMEGRTSFVIAHRLSTIREANRILVLESGQIKESGTHEELLKNRGHYYELYTSQIRSEKSGCAQLA